MAAETTVKVVDVHRVTPEPPPTHQFSLSLTFFDTFWMKLPPVERIFLYQLPDLSPSVFRSQLLPKLVRSLSLTLRHFLPVAGNLTWPLESALPIILYAPGDYVSITVAESTDDFNRLAGDGVREAADSLPYIPDLIASESTAAILSLQVTLFPGQGFCIGVSAHHGILDGKTQAVFIKAWAYICKQIGNNEGIRSTNPLPDFLTPVFDRSLTRIENSEEIAVEYLNNWYKFQLEFPGMNPNPNPRSLELLWSIVDSSVKRLSASFKFSKQRIIQLRESVVLKSAANFHFSSFVLTLAYTLVCLVKAKGLTNDETIQAGFTADFRSRLDPPVPDNYFGNCVHAFEVMLRAADVVDGGGGGVGYVARKIAETIEAVERGVMVGAKERLTKLLFPEADQFAVGVAGSPRLGMYGVDFGYGQPAKVEIASTARTGAISMAESGDGSGGLEVGVVLKEEEMELFCAAFNDGFRVMNMNSETNKSMATDCMAR